VYETFFALFSAATRTMLLERLSRPLPALLLSTLSVDDALLSGIRLELVPGFETVSVVAVASAAAADAAAVAGRALLPVPGLASP